MFSASSAEDHLIANTEGVYGKQDYAGGSESAGVTQSSCTLNNDIIDFKASRNWTGETSEPLTPDSGTTGEDGTGKNMPPYYKLAFIMKV
jgi:hypothetical protein